MAYRYSVEVRHSGLGKYRVISGTDEYVVKAKARAQISEWDHLFEVRTAKERRQSERESKRSEEAGKKQEAADRTAEAEQALDEVRGLLKATLKVNDAIDWEQFKNHEPFPAKEPRKPIYKEFPQEPQPDSPQFRVVLTLFDKMVRSRAERKQAGARALLNSLTRIGRRTSKRLRLRTTNATTKTLPLWRNGILNGLPTKPSSNLRMKL